MSIFREPGPQGPLSHGATLPRGALRYSVAAPQAPRHAPHAWAMEADADPAPEPPDAEPYRTAGAGPALRWRPLAHGAGAVTSLALMAGLVVWGAGEMRRDLSQVPVIAASDAPMRVAPEVPGGQVSDQAGFAVNRVKAGEPSEPRTDGIRHAPPDVALAEEDRPMPGLSGQGQAGHAAADAPAITPADPEAGGTAPAPRLAAPETPGVLATAPALGVTEGVAPAIATAEEIAAAHAVAASLTATLSAPPAGDAGDTADPAAPSAAAPAPAPVRPQPRPEATEARLSSSNDRGDDRGNDAGVEIASLAPIGLPEPRDDSAPVAPGTRLVQLGAYDSAETARAEWQRLGARFAPLMEGKARLVQEGGSDPQARWRLRAEGFDDLAQARRFCTALIAEGADCIPVVAR